MQLGEEELRGERERERERERDEESLCACAHSVSCCCCCVLLPMMQRLLSLLLFQQIARKDRANDPDDDVRPLLLHHLRDLARKSIINREEREREREGN